MNVTKVDPHPKNAEWRIVTTDDARQFIVFAGALADALEVGKPLPHGTEEQEPKFDGALPSLRLPKPRGGPGGVSAYRNTKEGSQAEQERMDRRTALMQAVAWVPRDPQITPEATMMLGDLFYAWLRKTSGSGPTGGSVRPESDSTSGPSGVSSRRAEGPDASSAAERGSPVAETGTEGEAEPGFGEGPGKPTPPSPEQWGEAGEIGLTPAKAVVLARRKGWDDVNSSSDLSDEQLKALISQRRSELE